MTQNQRLILNALISMALTALVASLQTIIQAHSGSGAVDIPALITGGLVVFGGSFWPALVNYVPAHVQQELQALRDAQQQLAGNHTTTATMNVDATAQGAAAPVSTTPEPTKG